MTKDIKKEFYGKKVEEIKEKYAIKPPQTFDATKYRMQRRKEMVACSLLIEEMEDKGASDDELMDILSYCFVLFNTEKLGLDWEKAYEDYKIDHYIEKYVEETIK